MTSAGEAFILRTDLGPRDGLRVAVKDLIDLAGTPTTCGSRAVDTSVPAGEDAECAARLRAAGVRFVGKTALHELAFGVTGENPWYGTPVNPLDPSRVPGGSSSGSAVAVAAGEADFALGTDTGGSIRIPAACCGIAGLKTTWGSLPVDGIRPLARSFDTVGPMAANVAAVAAGYELLAGVPAAPASVASGLEAAATAARQGTVARVRGLEGVDREIDDAVDDALARAGVTTVERAVDGWDGAFRAHRLVLAAEAYAANRSLLSGPSRDGLGADVLGKLERGGEIAPGEVEKARAVGEVWRSQLLDLLTPVGVLALPTIPCPPPLLGAPWDRLVWLTAPINLAGFPALALPVPLPAEVWSGGRASLQLVGPPGSERELLALGKQVEAAAGR